MKRLYIYADGSTLASGAGPSGYGSIIVDGKYEQELSQGYVLSTNNRMELMGVIAALEGLSSPRRITITSDSQYVKNGITQFIHAWRARNWIKADGNPVLNKDLWMRLSDATKKHIIQWEWVKGHAGHPENERCDVLAKAAAALPNDEKEEDTGYVTFNTQVIHKHYPSAPNWAKYKKWRPRK